jgi:curved DNA-binding protein CbpA
MRDFYEVMGVPKGATAVEIRQAYVRLAKEKHPDRFKDPVEKSQAESFFKDLTTAYNTLSHDGRRQEYDREHEKPKPANPVEIARAAYESALALIEQGAGGEETVTLLRSAVHHQPEEARYHAALGRFLGKRTTSNREAIQCLERASQLEPRNASLHADLALLFHKQGLHLRAQKAIEQALRLAPRDAQIQRIAVIVGA